MFDLRIIKSALVFSKFSTNSLHAFGIYKVVKINYRTFVVVGSSRVSFRSTLV